MCRPDRCRASSSSYRHTSSGVGLTTEVLMAPHRTLQALLEDAAAHQELGTYQKLRQGESVLNAMKAKLDKTLDRFNLQFNIRSTFEVARVSLAVTDIERVLPEIPRRLNENHNSVSEVRTLLTESMALQGPLPRVPVAEGTSWDPARVCLPGTRTWLLDHMMNWVRDPNVEQGAKVYWLTGVAGSGKQRWRTASAKRYTKKGCFVCHSSSIACQRRARHPLN